MKKLILSISITAMMLIALQLSAQVSINTDGSSPNNSAMLDVKSTTRGFLLPRMTHAELNAISNPADGLMVYCTDCGSNGLGSLSLFIAGIWYTLNTSCLNPLPPVTGTHIPSPTQITWNWNTVVGAIGYKWNTINDYATATDMGTSTTKTETGLTCGTSYTRYVWAYNTCGNSISTALTQSTSGTTIPAPITDIHIPSPTQIIWNWKSVIGASGYKWNTTNDYATALDMGVATSKTETGLTCNTPYTRYVWAYSACGNSTATTLNQNTSLNPPAAPTSGIHVPFQTQIIWNWNTSPGATGYKWNTTNNYGTATNMGTNTSITETGLTCNTEYTRYVWAYSPCGNSGATTLTQATNGNPASPAAGTHVPSPVQIVWNWNSVPGATGYKLNVTPDYNTATDMGTGLTKTETGLNCNTLYTRYVWAYNTCGYSGASTLTQTTSSNPTPPSAGTHIPSPTQIIWNWNSVEGATGYKWNITPDYNSATDMGVSLTKTETGLICMTLYTRYIWAYNSCGHSAASTVTQTTSSDPPASPASGTHVPTSIQITWNWHSVSGASGYKWNTTNDYATATNLGTDTTKTETGLSCGTLYTRYVWAYRTCGTSTPTTLTQSTLSTVSPPASGTHVPSGNQIVWNWNAVTGATGYKWNTINDYASATDMGAITTKTETGLTPGVTYTRYVWAYNTCGISTATVLVQALPFMIGQSYGGGIIFYIDGTGQHGLIAAASNQSTGAPWGCTGILIGGTSTAIGSGQANTTAIVNGCSQTGIAARICDELVLNGYSDWFLPSKDELDQMYIQKGLIGGFTSNNFWSSSEMSADSAWYEYFGNGNKVVDFKYQPYYVRAVRAF